MTKSIKVFLLTAFLVGSIPSFVSLRINTTQSLPQKYFLQIKSSKAERGDYTLTSLPWLKIDLIKQIIGVAGDKLHYDISGNLWLNNFKIGIPYKQSSNGKRLNPVQAGCIPQGYVFLYSPHPKSLDSRYDEVGLIPAAMLEGKVLPLW